MTNVLGLHKYSLQATIDHNGPSMYVGYYTSILAIIPQSIVAKTLYCNDSIIADLKCLIPKNAYLL